MPAYTPGVRVNTPHGPGTVAGFEAFDEKGFNIEPSHADNGNRTIVALDDPAAWPVHAVHPEMMPHYWPDEISPIYTHDIGHTLRSADGQRRVTYQPDWSLSQPWVSYRNGTAGRHFATENQAKNWLTSKD